MTLGTTPSQPNLLRGTGFVGDRVGDDSLWALLHRDGHRLFPDELFADLFTGTGRRSVPPQIVATVMVLQRSFGLSDREAVSAFEFDNRWKYACGGLDIDYPGFSHTVLVDMRARLARSERPKRIFEVTLDAARAAGMVGRKRVLDSTPLYDAVATQDTVTMIRSAIRALLKATDRDLVAELRAQLGRDDDYSPAGKPVCDWDDKDARAQLIHDLAVDGYRCLQLLEDRELEAEVAEAAALLAAVVGQDLEQGEDGRFKIVWGVAKDRIISTVDPDARHGHKTAAKGFDGYKGHISIDPDSEIITETTVTAGNVGDAAVAKDLIGDLTGDSSGTGEDAAPAHDTDGEGSKPKVFGDSAYGSGEFQHHLEEEGLESGCRTQAPTAAGGRYPKSRFGIDLDAQTVTCPNQVTVSIRRNNDRSGTASFGDACTDCSLREHCTKSKTGRTISVGIYEASLTAARLRQQAQAWVDDYRATRPKVERKIGHLMRRRHGGRRTRVRGLARVDADFTLLAAAANLARLAVLGVAV